MDANTLIYTGLGLLLAGALFGFFVAVKGYHATEWKSVRRIPVWGNFQHGKQTPAMKRLVAVWVAIMIAGFITVGIGISLGLR